MLPILIERLGLSDDEALEIFDVDPLGAIGGGLEQHRPELAILDALSTDAVERVGAATLRRWLRADGPVGRPLALLLAGDFAAFEDALAMLVERGLVLRGGRPVR